MKRAPRVLVVYHSYAPQTAGGERMATQLCDWLAQKTVSAQGIGLSSRRIGRERCRAAIAEEIARFGPDILHCFDLADAGVAAGAADAGSGAGLPVVITPASSVAVWSDLADGRSACAAATAVLALTEAERSSLIDQGVPETVIHVLGQAIPPPAVPGTDSGDDNAHPADAPAAVLFLGRKMRTKGYEVLLRATKRVWSSFPCTQFWFVGPHIDQDCAQIFASHRDTRVLEVGKVTDSEKWDRLHRSSLVCLPSSVDVAPLVVLEAWSLRKPVIVGDYHGVHSYVRDGHNAMVTSVEPAALAQAICTVLGDPALARSLADNGYATYHAEATQDRVMDRILDIYRIILETRNGSPLWKQSCSRAGAVSA
jgi:glycosyltransferase involved in cell wall biosynthesis